MEAESDSDDLKNDSKNDSKNDPIGSPTESSPLSYKIEIKTNDSSDLIITDENIGNYKNMFFVVMFISICVFCDFFE
jgi:hypothetical protein